MKDIKTLLSRNIKFLENVFFGGVVRGSAERVFICNDTVYKTFLKIFFLNIILSLNISLNLVPS